MNKQMVARGSVSVAVVGLLLASTYGCDQSKPKCAAARGAFIGVYRHVGGPATCADLKGEKLGFSTYNPVGKNNQRNLDIASIAIQSESLGTLVDTAEGAGVTDPDPTHKPYGLGFFTTAEPEGDICVVPSLTVAAQNIPAVAADPKAKVKASAATSVSYAWSNVRLYVTPSAVGSQFLADLTLTTDGVACDYQVRGMYPYLDPLSYPDGCVKPNPADPNGALPDDRICRPEGDEDPSVECSSNTECFSGVCDGGFCRCETSAGCCADKDVGACEGAGARCADAPAGAVGVGKTCHDAPRATGSGINPDFPVKCDPDLLVCVLSKEGFPALK
jgi:hypothetical protein